MKLSGVAHNARIIQQACNVSRRQREIEMVLTVAALTHLARWNDEVGIGSGRFPIFVIPANTRMPFFGFWLTILEFAGTPTL